MTIKSALRVSILGLLAAQASLFPMKNGFDGICPTPQQDFSVQQPTAPSPFRPIVSTRLSPQSPAGQVPPTCVSAPTRTPSTAYMLLLRANSTTPRPAPATPSAASTPTKATPDRSALEFDFYDSFAQLTIAGCDSALTQECYMADAGSNQATSTAGSQAAINNVIPQNAPITPVAPEVLQQDNQEIAALAQATAAQKPSLGRRERLMAILEKK